MQRRKRDAGLGDASKSFIRPFPKTVIWRSVLRKQGHSIYRITFQLRKRTKNEKDT